MAENYGWVGKILIVDLTTGVISTVPTSNYVPKFIGGRALAAKLYWDEVPPTCGAFDPENRIIFATGPAGGALAPGTSRTAIVAKSPESIPECYQYSTPGGHWGAELKFAGFDAVVVRGKAKGPCYILIQDSEVSILKADRLWGLGTAATDTEIRKLWGDKTRLMVIGPAGENLLRGGAAIISDFGHGAGNGSLGAVMGSKNLKAIAVKGTGSVKIARPKDLIQFYDDYVRIGGKYGGPHRNSSPEYNGAQNNPDGEKIAESDPLASIDKLFNEVDSQWSNWWLSRDEVKAGRVKMKFEGCFACPACCGLAEQAQSPTGKEALPYDLDPPLSVGSQCHEYEYENVFEAQAFGGKTGGRSCMWDCFMQNDMGVSSHAIASNWDWWKEGAIKDGTLNRQNTGFPVDDGAAMSSEVFCGKKGWTYALAYRTNAFWKLASEGRIRFLEAMAKESPAWKKLCDTYVYHPRYHTDHKKAGNMSAVDMLYHATAIRDQSNDPRGSFSGVGKQLSRFVPQAEINKALAANRAKWAFLFGPKSFELSGEPATFEGKVRSVILFQNMNMEFNSTPGCGWYGYPRFFSVWTPDHLCEPQSNKVFSAVTGIDCTFGEYLNMMEPAWTLERAIHVREGRRREHDWYSEATFAATKWTTKDEFNKVLDEYYTARGWDKTTGIPTRTQLEKLGMKDVADDLEKKYGVKVPA